MIYWEMSHHRLVITTMHTKYSAFPLKLPTFLCYVKLKKNTMILHIMFIGVLNAVDTNSNIKN